MNKTYVTSILLCLSWFTRTSIAQDIIVSTSGDTINCKIIEQQNFVDIEGGYIIFERDSHGATAKIPLNMVRCYRKSGKWRGLSQIRYDQLTGEVDFKRFDEFESYVSKRGELFSVGDTIKICSPSGNHDHFIHIKGMDITGSQFPVNSNRTNTYTVIKKIRIGGSKRTGWKVSLQTQGGSFLDNYFLFVEDAIDSGEIRTSFLSSDEALEQLKRAKDKLDLELINQFEYDSIKASLLPYIK